MILHVRKFNAYKRLVLIVDLLINNHKVTPSGLMPSYT